MPTIQIQFETEKLDKNLLESLILEYLFSHVNRDDLDKATKLNLWTVKILPVSMIVNDKDWKGVNGKVSGGIPHGVTDVEHKVCKIWVNDIKNDLIVLQNFMTISHELAHLLLSIFYPNKLGTYRYDDKSWGRAGKQAKFFVTEVHDREHEMSVEGKWIRRIIIHKNSFLRIKSWSVPCFDITDLTDTRKENRDHRMYG